MSLIVLLLLRCLSVILVYFFTFWPIKLFRWKLVAIISSKIICLISLNFFLNYLFGFLSLSQHTVQGLHADIYVHHIRIKMQGTCWSKAPKNRCLSVLPSSQDLKRRRSHSGLILFLYIYIYKLCICLNCGNEWLFGCFPLLWWWNWYYLVNEIKLSFYFKKKKRRNLMVRYLLQIVVIASRISSFALWLCV